MRALRPLVLASLAGCGTPEYAVVDGKRVTRPTLGYGDGFRFAIEHRRAFPDVLDFDAAWYGHRVELTGRADVAWHREFTKTGGLFGLSLDITSRRRAGDASWAAWPAPTSTSTPAPSGSWHRSTSATTSSPPCCF